MTRYAPASGLETPPALTGRLGAGTLADTKPELVMEEMEPMTLAEATDYLDWLEAHGREAGEIVVMTDGRVIVR